jgi:hypothetical protein
MLAKIVGFFLALCFFGLPLGIIGLFILSIVDQQDKTIVERSRRSRIIDQTWAGWSNVKLIAAGMILGKWGKSA